MTIKEKNKIIKKVLSKIAEKNKNILYHGSKNLFEKFDKKQQVSGFYPGVYLTDTEKRALEFGKNVYEVEVNGKFFEFDSPKQEDDLLRETGRTSSGWLLAEKLEKDGYVGIKRSPHEYVVFDPNNIKIIKK